MSFDGGIRDFIKQHGLKPLKEDDSFLKFYHDGAKIETGECLSDYIKSDLRDGLGKFEYSLGDGYLSPGDIVKIQNDCQSGFFQTFAVEDRAIAHVFNIGEKNIFFQKKGDRVVLVSYGYCDTVKITKN